MEKSGSIRKIIQSHASNHSTLKPIEATNVHLMAVSQIAEAINRGEWNAGDKLPSERELTDILGISRSSVRQALTALEAVGVIRKRAGVGSFVQDQALEIISQEIVAELVTEGDPLMLLEARQILEPELAGLAAVRCTDEDLQRMRTRLQEMDKFGLVEFSPSRFIESDIDFHLAIAAASHNPLLMRLFEEIADQMGHRVWLQAALPVVLRRATEYESHHQKIFAAIEAREDKKARQMMVTHLQGIRDNLRSISAITSEKSDGA